jgi:endonuclease YncB( thermonuclease family)
MRRRQFLQTTVAGVLGGLGLTGAQTVAADSQLEPGTWYDATVTDVTDGDTIDVVLDSDGTEYEIRTLGFDSPETKRNGRHESIEEWEGLEDDNYLADWGETAKDYAQEEFPDGTSVQIAVDENEDEFDEFGRLLAYVRYDKTGDGTMGTVYNKDVLELGYARVYGSSLTKHDEFWQAEHQARTDGLRVWQQSDPENSTEVDDDPVDTVFLPNVSSVRTDSGAIDPSRVPVFAEATATQQLDGGISYDTIPLVGLDEANNLALVGGLSINEAHESDQGGQHEVFLTNLVDSLGDGVGQVLITGGHREFNATHALSNEDAVYYQRYLEGQDIPFEQINTFDGTGDNALSTARALIVTNPPQAYTTAEVDALSTFISNGGAVILMASAAATDTMRSNLDDVAAGLGSDLRLNADQVFDDTNNVGDSALITTSNFDTSYPLFSAYTDGTNDAPTCAIVNPSDGETVSGTVTIQVDASDAEDDDTTLDVDVAIDGGTWQDATYNSTSGYYELDWDTTGDSDGDHTVDARATDADGATTGDSVTVTVDNVEDAPTVDSLSLEEVETDDSDAEFDAAWQVSDADGDLDSVDLTLTDDTDGETEDTATVAVSGDSASDTTRLVAAGDDGTGNSYTVELVVTDAAGNTASDTASATEGEPTETAPAIDEFVINDRSNPSWDKFDVDWAVSDADGDLAEVTSELLDSSGNVLDSESTAISGSSASDDHLVQSQRTSSEIVLTVVDQAGNSTSQTKSV